MYNTEDDVFIWNEFLAGNDRAYEFIYSKYAQTLFTYGLTLTDNTDLVQDCIHDIFVRIYENRKNLGTTNNIRLYLVSALKNSILMAFRKQQSYNKFKNSIDEEYWEDSESIIDKLISSEEETEQKAVVDRIWSILTTRQKEIVYYRFVGGLSLSEIAERQNMDYQSVANIIYRAIKKIKKFYSKSD
ncbi:sigma-70 family RNA polymerase sigma factor [Proteiniphilum sp.]|uniref:RNA polymerase sigma factor n=1 Tax=Proteiniphilum sp. TaxID=1926877 RepID=UPI002B2155BB|nr:sigma-70 family RNA polymerase sigma factor [Proteiniphilum sp.]MEA4916082.1 sigma-70 family RNA polymerase sigma factor [Proteiniphilum sp.]